MKLVIATATLTLLVGAVLLLARLLRLGFVANFISTPVLTGFKAGIGCVIVLDQLPKLLGIHITKQGLLSRHLQRGTAHPRDFDAYLRGGRRDVRRAHRVQAIPAAHSRTTGRHRRRNSCGVVLRAADKGVALVGLIPQGFPSLTLPDPALIANWFRARSASR
jgi:hypothetical protein